MKISKFVSTFLCATVTLGELVAPVIATADNQVPDNVVIDLSKRQIKQVESQRQQIVAKLQQKGTTTKDVTATLVASATSPLTQKIDNLQQQNQQVSVTSNIPNQSFKVNDSTTIDFIDDSMGIDTVNVSSETDATLQDENALNDTNEVNSGILATLDNFIEPKADAASKAKSKDASNTYNIYDMSKILNLGKIASFYVKGHFTYNGNKVHAYVSDHSGLMHGSISGVMASVVNKKDGVHNNDSSEAIAYQAGDIQGNGVWKIHLPIDHSASVSVAVTKNGVVHKTHALH